MFMIFFCHRVIINDRLVHLFRFQSIYPVQGFKGIVQIKQYVTLSQIIKKNKKCVTETMQSH